jgi:hypothetical protein
VALLALATLALAAACGGGASGSGVASLGSTTTTKASGDASAGAPTKFNPDDALKFSQCMRTHGVPNFPDPTSSGGGQPTIQLNGGPGSGLDPQSPQFQAAQSACKHLMPNGGQPSPQQQAQAKDAALHFAQCMRAHGVNVPDPQVSTNGGTKIQIGGGRPGQGPDPNSPQFQAAQSACQHFLPFNRSGSSQSPDAGSGTVSGSSAQ